MKVVKVDRSRVESFQRCNRLRYHQYHDGSDHIGIETVKKPLPLVVGGSVHKGLEYLLRNGQDEYDLFLRIPVKGQDHVVFSMGLEEGAVRAALDDFSHYTGALELDTAEAAQLSPTTTSESFTQQLAGSLGLSPEDAGLGKLEQRFAASRNQFDEYLEKEQAALVEALVRAYARRRLRPLLEQFVVLEVEREGEWLLSEWGPNEECTYDSNGRPQTQYDHALWFMSRPDALLLERESQQLYILSFKTAAQWDIRKERDAACDSQGLSEGVEIEIRLRRWWNELYTGGDTHESITPTMREYLLSQSSPPRVLAIRYEYLLKSQRWMDKDLSLRFGLTCYSQRSPLIRKYVAHSVPQTKTASPPFKHGDVCANWDYVRPEDMKESKLAWQNWKSEPVWESGTVREWIDRLDASEPVMSAEDSTVGMEPRMLGWKSEAQAMGLLKEHPLDQVFVTPIVAFRQEDELRDYIEQIESMERGIAEKVEQVHAATNEGEKRSLLNRNFPMTRKACVWPVPCAMMKICYGTQEVRQDPVGSSLYRIRVINHPQEIESVRSAKANS
jgi:hypothetical protein